MFLGSSSVVFFLLLLRSALSAYEDGLGGYAPLHDEEKGLRTDLYPNAKTTTMTAATTTTKGNIDTIMPHASEEEDKGFHIAEEHKCSACQAIAYQLQSNLITKETHRGGKALKDWEYLEVMENVCDNSKVWDMYGLKAYGGGNVLQGPGLPDLNEDFGDPTGAPMFQMVATKKGGYWGHRLRQRCHNMLGDTGEDEVYQSFTSGRHTLAEQLCDSVCTKEEFMALPKYETKPVSESKSEEKPRKKKSVKKKKKTKQKSIRDEL